MKVIASRLLFSTYLFAALVLGGCLQNSELNSSSGTFGLTLSPTGASTTNPKPSSSPSMSPSPRPSFSPPPPITGTPAWLNGVGISQWVPLQSISVQNDPYNDNGVLGSVKNVMDAWGGASLRASGSYFLVQGGGHGDYAGNQIYSLRLSDNNPQWQLIWAPTPANQVVANVPYYADGNPATAHTYYELQYDNVSDSLFRVMGGYWELDGVPPNFDSWKFGAANWDPKGTHPDVPNAEYPGGGTTINPVTGDVYFWDGPSRAIWSHATNKWSFTDNFTSFQFWEGPMGYDPIHNCVWAIGGGYTGVAGQIEKWDLATNTISLVNFTGNAAAIGKAPAMGMDYASQLKLFYLFLDGVVYVFDPASLTINTVPMTGSGPAATYVGTNGVWGKFKYAPELGGFVVAPAWNAPTYFFRAF